MDRANSAQPLSSTVCAGHGTKRVGWKPRYQVFAEPKARRRAPKVGALSAGVIVRWSVEGERRDRSREHPPWRAGQRRRLCSGSWRRGPAKSLCLSEMRPIRLVFLVFILSACTGHQDANDFDLVKLKGAVEQLFAAPTNENHIEKKWWPSAIKELNPESIMKGEKGIYIRLDSFFVEQSGLFIPLPGTTIELGVHSGPSYILLGEDIYSYYVTG